MADQSSPSDSDRGTETAAPTDDGTRRSLLDRAAAAAARRTTPRQAAAALIATVLVTATVLALTALSSGAGRDTAPDRWNAIELGAVEQPDPPPAHQPPRAVGDQLRPSPASGSPPPPQPTGEFTGWSVLDFATGAVTGSENMSEVSTTASMIKAWLVADYLRRTADAGERPSSGRLSQLELIIRDSNNEHAQTLFQEIGEHASIERLITTCGLTDSRVYPHYWSNTQLSPRDTARMGACIADGRAAGPEWTDWLLDEMRAVRGAGDFGIRHALPPDERPTVAIKNGWIDRSYDGNWHVNCLAIGDTWAMGIMLRYPVELGHEHGFERCRTIAAEQLLP